MKLFKSGKKKLRRAAEREELARSQRYFDTSKRINALFDSPERAAQRADFLAALRQQASEQLGRGYRDNSRQQRFTMARQGLTGGSADIDSQRRLQEALTRGRLAAEASVQEAGANLLDQDESARMNLLDAARGGMGTGQAAQRASQMMQTSLRGAIPGMLGDVFSTFAEGLRRQKEDAEYQRGARYDPWGP